MFCFRLQTPVPKSYVATWWVTGNTRLSLSVTVHNIDSFLWVSPVSEVSARHYSRPVTSKPSLVRGLAGEWLLHRSHYIRSQSRDVSTVELSLMETPQQEVSYQVSIPKKASSGIVLWAGVDLQRWCRLLLRSRRLPILRVVQLRVIHCFRIRSS